MIKTEIIAGTSMRRRRFKRRRCVERVVCPECRKWGDCEPPVLYAMGAPDGLPPEFLDQHWAFEVEPATIYYDTNTTGWLGLGGRIMNFIRDLIPLYHRLDAVAVNPDGIRKLWPVKQKAWAWFGRWVQDPQPSYITNENDDFTIIAHYYDNCARQVVFSNLIKFLDKAKLEMMIQKSVSRTSKTEFVMVDNLWQRALVRLGEAERGSIMNFYMAQSPDIFCNSIVRFTQIVFQRHMQFTQGVPYKADTLAFLLGGRRSASRNASRLNRVPIPV